MSLGQVVRAQLINELSAEKLPRGVERFSGRRASEQSGPEGSINTRPV